MVLERSLKFFLQKVEGVLNFKFLSESGFQSVGELIIKLEKVLRSMSGSFSITMLETMAS